MLKASKLVKCFSRISRAVADLRGGVSKSLPHSASLKDCHRVQFDND